MIEVNKIILNFITLNMGMSRVDGVLFLKKARTDHKKEQGKIFEKEKETIIKMLAQMINDLKILFNKRTRFG